MLIMATVMVKPLLVPWPGVETLAPGVEALAMGVVETLLLSGRGAQSAEPGLEPVVLAMVDIGTQECRHAGMPDALTAMAMATEVL